MDDYLTKVIGIMNGIIDLQKLGTMPNVDSRMQVIMYSKFT